MVSHFRLQKLRSNDSDEWEVVDEPPRITDLERWNELCSISEFEKTMGTALIYDVEEGEYPPTVYKVLYGFDKEYVDVEYTPPARLSGGISPAYWSDFVLFWGKVSDATEPFLLRCSTSSHGWRDVSDLEKGNVEPVIYYVYCSDGMVEVYEYNVVTGEKELADVPIDDRSIKDNFVRN